MDAHLKSEHAPYEYLTSFVYSRRCNETVSGALKK